MSSKGDLTRSREGSRDMVDEEIALVMQQRSPLAAQRENRRGKEGGDSSDSAPEVEFVRYSLSLSLSVQAM